MFTVADSRRVVEWTGSRDNVIDSSTRHKRNTWSNPAVGTRLNKNSIQQSEAEPYRSRLTYGLQNERVDAYGGREEHRGSANRREGDTSHCRGRREIHSERREKVRYRGQTRVSARTSNTRRVTRPHEARDPYRRNQREHVRRSRGRRADVDHRRSERRARSDDTHTHPGWSRTSEQPWGSRDPDIKRRISTHESLGPSTVFEERRKNPEKKNPGSLRRPAE